MRKALTAAALLLALTCPALAGEIGTPGVTAPPPPPAITQEEQTDEGEVPNSGPGSLTETVLTVLESVLALL